MKQCGIQPELITEDMAGDYFLIAEAEAEAERQAQAVNLAEINNQIWGK